MDFDVAVLGTGLSESITAAALSKAGYKVAHLDANTYYGADDASLSVDELVQWAQLRTGPLHVTEPSTYAISQSNRYTDISYHGLLPPQSRQYAISLRPTVIPSVGPLIDSLIASGVSRYGGFKLLEQVALYDGPGRVKPVPGSKEDIFKDKSLSLLHKRRLMRFLMFAGGDFEGKPELSGCEDEPFPVFLKEKFSLEDQAVQAIAYALAFCVSATDPTLPALQRIRRYLRSSGRYGSSPFLVGHYGGVGEIAQGFCRTAAVGGATYILGHSISSLSTSPSGQAPKYTIKLCDIDDELRCEMLIGSQDYPNADAIAERAAVSQPPTERKTVTIARCIAIIDCPLSFSPAQLSSEDATEGEQTSESLSNHQIDTAILVFPPAEPPLASSTAVHALVTGEASLSAPKGFWVVYLTMPLLDDAAASGNAEQLLQPYLDATLTLAQTCETPEGSGTAQPLWTLFYKELSQDFAHPLHITEVADAAVTRAEACFWRAASAFKEAGRRPRTTNEDGEQGAQEEYAEVLWPPLDYVEDDEGI